MKNKIFSLMAGAVILINSPLFAMEAAQDEEGKGHLCKLPSEVFSVIIDQIPDDDVVSAIARLSCTSKSMQLFCDAPNIWTSLLTRLSPGYTIIPDLSEKDQMKTNFSWFSDRAQTYNITKGCISFYKTVPYPDDNYLGCSYLISVGGRKFQFIDVANREVNVQLLDISDDHKDLLTQSFASIIHPKYNLEPLEDSAVLPSYQWKEPNPSDVYNEVPFPCFHCSFSLFTNPQDAGDLKFGTEEYNAFGRSPYNAGKAMYYIFYIRPLSSESIQQLGQQ
jgi:hypothetical protein